MIILFIFLSETKDEDKEKEKVEKKQDHKIPDTEQVRLLTHKTPGPSY